MPSTVPNDPITVYFIDPDTQQMDQATSGHIYNTIKQMGYDPIGISADGLTFTIKDNQGTFQMDAADILRNVGFDVKYVKPNAPMDNKIDFHNRLAISRLPDDDAKKAYLESRLKRQGIENPQVHGEGRDFYYYDQNDNQWHALTNSKSWDLSDLAEGGAEVLTGGAAGLGGLAGGIAGAGAGGIGAVPGAMAGAGAGSAVAETGLRGYLAATDPDFADTASLSGQAKDIALSAGLNAGLAGVPAVAGKVLPKLAGATEEGVRQFFRGGVVSPAIKGFGKTLQAGGSLANTAGGLAKTPLGKEAVKAAVPGLSHAQMASTMMQAPEFATVAAAKLGQKATQAVGSEEAKLAADQILTKQAPANLFERFNKWARGLEKPNEIKASNVLSNAAESAGKGLGAEEGTQAVLRNAGAKTGKAMEDIATLGRNLEKGTDVIVGTGATALQAGGKAAQLAGKGISAAGNVVQPFESQIAGQAAGREYLLPDAREKLMQKEKRDLQKKLEAKKAKAVTAYNP